MTINTTKTRCALMAIAVTALTAGLPTPADAGCLREYGRCGDCAKRKLWRAFRNLNFRKATEAYVDGADCDIDLFHCLLYAHHHRYRTCRA